MEGVWFWEALLYCNILILLDLDQMAYTMCLKMYLDDLNWCIERWSRMGTAIQSILVDHGAFHLLLNELYMAYATVVS